MTEIRYDPAQFLAVPRCQARSSAWPGVQSDPVQCILPASHNQVDQEVTHRHGARVWYENSDGSAHTLNAIRDYQTIGLIAEQMASSSDAEAQLRSWWFDKAASEIDQTVPKAIEYGSTDLIDIGLMLARTMRRAVSEPEAAELGVFFYLIGKVARWQSAIERGERPSDDTLLDIGVYVRMAQRIREAGGWPGTKPDQTVHSMCTEVCGPSCDAPAGGQDR